MLKWLKRVVVSLVALAIAILAAVQISPWPGVLVIRQVFDQGAATASAALEKHVPKGITATRAVQYDAADKAALLDIIYPQDMAAAQQRTVVVWTHGGGFISGRREDMTNYLHVLAGHGFIVANIDYAIAPSATYPTPVRQLNTALGFLASHREELKLGTGDFVLAGDSAGAQISAQTAGIITSPDYAKAVGIAPAVSQELIKGTVLFCGPYDLGKVRTDGPFGWFIRTVIWAYSGAKDGGADPAFQLMSVRNHATKYFPPTFISVGNADPLQPQSTELAETLTSLGVPVDSLFFPPEYQPPLAHEYQFNLDGEAGRQAMDRMVQFLQFLSASP